MKWRRLGDVGLWAALSFLVLAESGARHDPYWFRAVCLAVLAFAVFGRRRWPLVALSVVAWTEIVILAFALGTTNGVQIALVPAISLLSYLAGRRETQLKHFVLLCSWSLIGMLLLALTMRRGAQATESVLTWLLMLLLALLLVVLPWLIGRYRAQQALLATAGWERAERIEREQQMEIDQERLRERSRIAEDMHDSVGHELSLIALRAAALELDPSLPEEHRRAAGELRESAATATERLGEIVGVLRDQDAPTVPHDETVRALVDRAAASGLAVRLTEDVDGVLAPMVDRAVHRVVQESLTNASKHAPGASVTVSVTTHEDDVQVQVVDTGASQPVAAPSGGRGLDGLRERVRLAGGSFTAGPRPGGGFQVSATIPRAGGRPEPPTAAVERATVRRSAQRGLITAIAAPVLLGALVGAVALGYYLVAGYSAILRPAQYDGLTIGQSEADVAKVLPRMQMIDPPGEGYQPPADWSCRYYRPAAPFSSNYVYRLCFANGALVAKAVVQSGSVPPTPEGNG
ncbi:signal transduction histidine kinase [Kribbella sp. VKM Ac-2569]|uniref:sensor histidine kinase n=1 Tax=Kribbella sp. VKM Ac-2569 TaxID=2512220 RepID=UPI00102D0643|nr:histidine kinase [Kribbella sp. VKM Ac-2569]RZT17584.1 signal transduction histidine kinase [Kribbella sp. VKM Ac-2569]